MNTNHNQLSDDYLRIEQAILYLENHYKDQPSLEDVAANIGLSEHHFQRLFTRWAGVSPKRYLQFGPLGSEFARFDLAITSDGRQALISNLEDRKVFFVDLSSGTPVVSGMAKIDFFAEDIAIDPTNEWALVTDAGFTTRIAVLHIPTRSWVPAGVDPVTGIDRSERKGWFVERLEELAHIFLIDVDSFAIMSTHYHLILRNRPDLAAAISDEDVVRRWRALYAHRRDSEGRPAELSDQEIRLELNDREQLAECRQLVEHLLDDQVFFGGDRPARQRRRQREGGVLRAPLQVRAARG